MSTVTVSSTHQIDIPPDLCRRLNLQPGDKLVLLEFNGALRLLPLAAPASLRGIARDINPDVAREADRAL